MIESRAAKARARDGCLLSYRIYPQPGKARLVLIHSLALDASIWDGVAAKLNADAEILVYDCRGHGQSERRAGTYTMQLFAEDLAAILDHCEWPSAFVAGCSMGGCVAQAFGAAFPKRARGLGLIDTTAWYGPEAPADWRKRAETAAQKGFAAMLPFQVTRWFGDGFRAAHADVVEAASRVFLAGDLACYQSSCALLGNADLRSTLGSLRMPVSVIVGEEDYATPVALAEALHAAIPGSTLTIIRGGRHLTPIENSGEIAKLLHELLLRGKQN